jgi:hypothetical protein
MRAASVALVASGLQLGASTITYVSPTNGGFAPSNQNCNVTWTAGTGCGASINTWPAMGSYLLGNDLVFKTGTGISSFAHTGFSPNLNLSINSLTIGTGFLLSINTLNTLTVATDSVNAGKLAVGGTLTLNGNLNNAGGLIQGGGTGTAVNNNGTITGGAIVFNGLFNNANGTVSGLTVMAAATITGGKVAGVITNNGTLSGVTNLGTVNGGLLAGLITNTSGTLNGVTNTGTITGGVLTGGTNNLAGTVNGVTNKGTIGGGTVKGAVDGTVGTFSNVIFSGANLTNGTIVGANTFNGTNTLDGIVTNNGTINISSGTTTVASTGTLVTDNGVVNVNGGTLSIAGVVDQAGLVTLSSGSINLNGSLDVSVLDLLGGTIDGPGTITGGATVNNGDGTNDINSEGVLFYVGGSVASGGTGLASETLGAYNQDSGGTLGLTFANNTASGHNKLITGSAALNGTLDLFDVTGAMLNTNMLNTSLVYELIDSTSGPVVGQFSTVNAVGVLTGSGLTLGSTPGWWLVYNGSLAGTGGDVELDYVASGINPFTTTPEPATDILLGCGIIAAALLRRKLTRR